LRFAAVVELQQLGLDEDREIPKPQIDDVPELRLEAVVELQQLEFDGVVELQRLRFGHDFEIPNSQFVTTNSFEALIPNTNCCAKRNLIVFENVVFVVMGHRYAHFPTCASNRSNFCPNSQS
jgi:hypothetical protein